LPEAAFACFRPGHGEFKAIGRSGKSNRGRKKQKSADSSDRRRDGDNTAITGGDPVYYDVSKFWDCLLG
jgi:hypothetical protein